MKTLHGLLALFLLALATPVAALNIFACEPEWAALARELGGDKVEVFAATTAFQDPHRIEARPSLIAKLRRADLLVCSGAELEIGWLPMLLRQAGNGKVQPGRPGHFEAARHIERLEIPTAVDRSMGDVHASGNPHVHLDPRRLATIAQALSAKLRDIDPGHADDYAARQAAFAQRWQQALAGWEQKAQPLRGVRLVAHHKDWVYLADWLGFEVVATLEPKPGLPASAGHLAALKAQLQQQPARMVIRTAYQDSQAAHWLSTQTGIPAVELPYTVGGSERAGDLFALFDDTIDSMLGALH